MTAAWAPGLLAAAGLLAWALTAAVRRFALRQGLLDHPNERSSHVVPTPRGGGVAIAAVALGGIAAGALLGVVPIRAAGALLGGGAAVSLVGWVDDRRGLPPRTRALVHFLAAGWAVGWLGGLPALRVGGEALPLGPAGAVLAALGIVWGVNAYNFMDGIDGIAAVQGVIAGVAGGGILLAAGAGGLAWAAFVVAGAAGGFLVWNRPPARIFMGDVGSGLLGYLFSVLALASERADALPLLGWVLLLGVFFFDATTTLVRRIWRGERFHEAHRSHAYQRVVQAGWSHGRATAAAGLLSLLLAAGAVAAFLRPALQEWLLLAAAALLAASYMWVEGRRPMSRPGPGAGTG